MSVLTLDQENSKKGNKLLNFIKNISNKILDLINLMPHHNDTVGVDTRSQTERYLDKTGEMYELEQENAKKEAEKMKAKTKNKV